MSGGHVIDWDYLCAAVDHGLNIQIWQPLSFGFIMDHAVVPYLSMRALMGRRRLQQRQKKSSPSPSSSPASQAEDLLYLLIHCRHRSSADSRDKIYSVMGFLHESHDQLHSLPNQLSIELDYGHPVVYIYRLITQFLIRQSGTLDVLGVCPKSTRRALPSWVTDWSITSPIRSPLSRDSMDRPRRTHATGYTKADALPFYHSESQESVGEFHKPEHKREWFTRVSGIFKAEHRVCQDVLAIVSTLFSWEKFAAFTTPTATAAMRPTTARTTNPSDNKSNSSSAPSEKSPENDKDAYWQTLCAETYKSHSRTLTSSLYETWSTSLEPLRSFLAFHPHTSESFPEVAFKKFLDTVWDSYVEFWPYINCANHRRMGQVSEPSRLCLLPEAAQLGDKIILARGGKVPLVLRADEDGYYMFVGEAYVHGVMEGEGWDESRCEDVKIC
ncbi:uncharacterized protein BCR38DRAFT_488904 [Pseudomassariella vexata]|uniref:Heterokaryon incompatibility protein-domain-containing protein n=1 Tax=Pseudomassariella vexata TaxID=1141098 RepID=A0A1Y2DK75_9PEZI|nr:uncharacterized protein BCR38DRAFT_488904 [Pseudomassariella vexata]ORY59165.1 hypothetical protein BCR38DRAFT_488904 [Pseudomassariella vexata]